MAEKGIMKWAISFTNSAVDDGFVSPFFIGARQ